MNMISVWPKERWTKEMWHFRWLCDFSAKVYSMHSQINEEKPASMIQRKWKYFGASFNLVDIVWISCSCLLANKLFLTFVFTVYPSSCNLNLLQFMEFCLMAIPVQKCNIAENNSAPHFSWNSNFSYMRKFFCFLSLRFFYFFAHCFLRCTPTTCSWMPGRGYHSDRNSNNFILGGYEYFHSHYDDCLKHMVNSTSTAFSACFMWITSSWLTGNLDQFMSKAWGQFLAWLLYRQYMMLRQC